MGIVTLFKRFKELAAAAEKSRDNAATPSEQTSPEETASNAKSTLAETVLQIQKMQRNRPHS